MSDGLTVVIPTRDRSDVIDRTLAGFAGQSVTRPAEVVVVDNGSTDGTLEHARAWSGRDTPVPVRVVQEAVPGVSAARNRGVAEAAYTGILFVNDDSVPVSTDLLAAHQALLAATPQGRAHVGRVTYPPDLMKEAFHAWLNDFAQFDYRALDAGRPPRAHHFITAHVSFARADFDTIGGMEQRMRFGFEDAEIGARLLAAGVVIEYRPELVVHHEHRTLPSQWRRRTVRMGAAGAQLNHLRADRSRLAPHTVGPYWLAQQLAADGLAPVADRLMRLPPALRDVAFQLLHQGSYTRGYRAALRHRRQP